MKEYANEKKERNEMVLGFFKQGLTYREIAEKVGGISRQRVEQIVKKLDKEKNGGLNIRYQKAREVLPKYFEEGTPLSRVSKETHIPICMVRKIKEEYTLREIGW